MIIHIQKEKLHKDFETIGEPRFPCLYVSDFHVCTYHIDRVSTEEVSARVRNSSLFSLNVLNRDSGKIFLANRNTIV